MEEEQQPQNLAHIHWSWPEAIAANPAHSLANADLAMDYFAYSPFWDAQSNNNQLRTQRRVENPTYGHAEEKVELASFRGGFEYIVAHARAPDVFVIHRRSVLPDGGRGPVTHAYFILQDKIYMAPNLYDIAQVRLRNATYLLERTFADLEKARPAANPRATGQWLAVARDENSKKKAALEGGKVEGDKSDDKEAATGGPPSTSSQAAGPTTAGPDWHLFYALTSTRAALGDIDRLAAAPPPTFDEAAEAEVMDAMAAAAVGRPVPGVTLGQGSGASVVSGLGVVGGPRSASVAPTGTESPTRAGSVMPILPPPPPALALGTPRGYAPSPLRQASGFLQFPGESPAPV